MVQEDAPTSSTFSHLWAPKKLLQQPIKVSITIEQRRVLPTHRHYLTNQARPLSLNNLQTPLPPVDKRAWHATQAMALWGYNPV